MFWPILEDQANTFAPGDPGRSFQFSRDTVSGSATRRKEKMRTLSVPKSFARAMARSRIAACSDKSLCSGSAFALAEFRLRSRQQHLEVS